MVAERHQQVDLPAALPHSFAPPQSGHVVAPAIYQFRTRAKTSGATIVASDSMMNFGVLTSSLPHVIFSLGSAPEYDP
jgi:hypothetical protein